MASEETQDLQTDPLFVGLTRQATIMGVPYFAFVAEVMAVGVVFLGVGNPIFLLLFAPLHAVLYLVSASNPRIFSEIAMWVLTKGRCLNTSFWGGASFSHRSHKRWEE